MLSLSGRIFTFNVTTTGGATPSTTISAVSRTVFTAFEHSCVRCGTGHNLTFDHYGLAKNEGGNFALILADKASIRLNIVVLCRACNAEKGQRSYQLYFSDAQRDRAMGCQRVLLDSLLCDEEFLKLIKKWH